MEATTESTPQPTQRSAQTRDKWRTPRTVGLAQKTPRTHRLLASAGPKTPHKRSQAFHYEALLRKTWRAHALSPLFKFQTSATALKLYGRSLDVAFSKGVLTSSSPDLDSTHSRFETYHGLSFHADDPDAIRITVTERQDDSSDDKTVLSALLLCVDIGQTALTLGQGRGALHATTFTFYPVLLVSGTKSRSHVLADWLQRHFDCRVSPMEFSDSDLRWILALGCRQDADVKSLPVCLQYDVRGNCDGINTLDCKFESTFCKELWDRLQQDNETGSGSCGGEILTEVPVTRFMSALEQHLEYTMHVSFKKLKLSEVGTPVAHASRDGKIKMLTAGAVYVILHLICDVITDRLTHGYQRPSDHDMSTVP